MADTAVSEASGTVLPEQEGEDSVRGVVSGAYIGSRWEGDDSDDEGRGEGQVSSGGAPGALSSSEGDSDSDSDPRSDLCASDDGGDWASERSGSDSSEDESDWDSELEECGGGCCVRGCPCRVRGAEVPGGASRELLLPAGSPAAAQGFPLAEPGGGGLHLSGSAQNLQKRPAGQQGQGLGLATQFRLRRKATTATRAVQHIKCYGSSLMDTNSNLRAENTRLRAILALLESHQHPEA